MKTVYIFMDQVVSLKQKKKDDDIEIDDLEKQIELINEIHKIYT